MGVYNNATPPDDDADAWRHAAVDVPVIFVGDAAPPPRSCPSRPVHGRGSLRSAACALHRMADYVENMRRSIERTRDGV
jgi:hypothetical protein